MESKSATLEHGYGSTSVVFRLPFVDSPRRTRFNLRLGPLLIKGKPAKLKQITPLHDYKGQELHRNFQQIRMQKGRLLDWGP